MFANDLDTVRENAKKVVSVPAFASELKPYELEEIKNYAQVLRRVLMDKYGVVEKGEETVLGFYFAGPTLEDHNEWRFVEKIESWLAGRSAEAPGKKIERFQWLGSQKQLAELFIELKRKGWIDEIKTGTLKACFTKTDSIEQILKPSTQKVRELEQDAKKVEYVDTYSGVFTPRYKPMFYGIKSLP